ncbi:hypothetical protein BV20DRAFT_970580 [Pilatotrama ljubarskyi]|nr:hypothetical protein BV20DRAFT_970580 [Pilatotrama ljubarskyi]
MQSTSFAALLKCLFVMVAATAVVAIPTSGDAPSDEPAPYVTTLDQMMRWLAATDAEVTFSGEPINPLNTQQTTITFCSHRSGNLCSGPCNVFTGSGVCHATPGTNCLSATTDVSFCDGSNCGGSCNQFNSCGTHLENGFCATPGTNSVSLPP